VRFGLGVWFVFGTRGWKGGGNWRLVKDERGKRGR